MHEKKYGELKSGIGKKVTSKKQAIALHEAGASKYESKAKNKSVLAKSKSKELSGKTAMQKKEGKGALKKKTTARKPQPTNLRLKPLLKNPPPLNPPLKN